MEQVILKDTAGTDIGYVIWVPWDAVDKLVHANQITQGKEHRSIPPGKDSLQLVKDLRDAWKAMRKDKAFN